VTCVKVSKIIRYLKKIRFPDIILAVFSLLFLGANFAAIVEQWYYHRGFSDRASAMQAAILGTLCCLVPISAWAVRWKKLGRNYRDIALFFYILFLTLLFIHVRTILIDW